MTRVIGWLGAVKGKERQLLQNAIGPARSMFRGQDHLGRGCSLSERELEEGRKQQGHTMEKYVRLAKEMGMVNAMIISPKDMFFDIRAMMKCRWGCEDYFQGSIKCHARGTTFHERVEMVQKYNDVLVVHSHDAHALSTAVLEIERTAFLDGHYFGFAVRYCRVCKSCAADKGQPCAFPEKVRPCDQSFGIDVYRTARSLGLPCNVLQDKEDVQNRYGFVLID